MKQDKCSLKVLYDNPYCRDETPYFLKELKLYHEEREPIIGKTGWYYDRHNKLCWIESYGRAWFTNRTMKEAIKTFMFNLKFQTHSEKPFSKKEVAGLSTLVRRGIHKKYVQEMLMFQQHYDVVRDIRVRSKMSQIKMFNRVRNFKNALKEKHKDDGKQKV